MTRLFLHPVVAGTADAEATVARSTPDKASVAETADESTAAEITQLWAFPPR